MAENKGDRKQAGLSRRDFFKEGFKVGGAGIAAAALSTVPFLSVRALNQDEVETWDRETDVLVVGYGGAGACAAIEARDAGAEVVILEKREIGGGTTAVSGGWIYAGGSSVQRRHGIDDSAEAMCQHVLNAGKGMNDPDLVRVAAERSADNVEWLIELGGGFPDAPAQSGPDEQVGSEPVARAHQIRYQAFDRGVAFFRVLSDAVAARDVKVLYGAAVQRLVVGDDRVVGVRMQHNGQEENVRARRAVVLATGGFAHNGEMLTTYSRQGHYSEPLTPPGLTGDGQRMAFALGAGAAAMTCLSSTPGFRLPDADRGTAGPTVGIMVNLRGERFVDEHAFYDWRAALLARQPDARAFLVFDERIRKEKAPIVAQFSESLEEEVQAGRVLRADSLAALAEAMGVPGERLEATVARWNHGVEDGNDPDFGRSDNLVRVEEGPFYALELVPTMYDTAGGVRTDENARVLSVFGDVIHRLYAGGTVAGGVLGEYYPGSGSALNVAVTFGRIAGRNAAAQDGAL